jgi:hypothetical protein
MYDIYLSSACKSDPDLSGLEDKYSFLSKIDFQSCLSKPSPHFLGLDIPKDDAIALWKRLETAGARGLYVQAKYREPNVPLEVALEIAKKNAKEQQSIHWPGTKFEPTKFLYEDAMWWKFSANSNEWLNQGRVPSALYVLVDKLDGHIWLPEEQEEFSREIERERYG